MYWSLYEFGRRRLSSKHWWMPLLCETSSLISEVDGGLGTVFTEVLKLFFKTGSFKPVVRCQGDVACVLEVDLGMVLADEAALMQLFHAKGTVPP